MSDCEEIEKKSLPAIGILCIDISQKLNQLYDDSYYSFLVASYVKHLEIAGSRVIPIWNNRPKSYYVDIMSKVNGIVIPGGAIFFNKKYCKNGLTNDSFTSSQYIFEIATELNCKGIYFPLWGTCLGFQLLVKHSIKEVEDVRQDCKPMKCSLPVQFEDDKVLQSSKLFNNLPSEMKEGMRQRPFGFHSHQYCITKEDLNMYKIHNKWTVLATNQDENGLEFISIIEHKDLPFYGVQFHPERVFFEYTGPDDACHHCVECFEINQYFSKFFIQECSKNTNRFKDFFEELRHSVHNFPLINVAEHKLNWQQCFLFEEDVDYRKPNVKKTASNGED